MKILGVIPARYASTRFPGKPLAMIGDQTMIERVYRQCRKATLLSDVMVATDDPRIFQAVLDFGGNAVMTDTSHPTGTDRIIEVKHAYSQFDAYINIQGDEPFISPDMIDEVCRALHGAGGIRISTLVRKFDDLTRIYDPNTVKVALGTGGKALYFSRSPIPWMRGEMDPGQKPVTSAMKTYHAKHGFWQHVGIYGYTFDALSKVETLSQGVLEIAESLEQLRWLENGIPVFAGITDGVSVGIDTPEDLAKAIAERGL